MDNNENKISKLSKRSQARIKDLTNMQFGYLTVIEFTGKFTNSHNAIWTCLCSKCGNKTEVSSSNLRGAVSCGCWRSNFTFPDRKSKICSNCRNELSIAKFAKNSSRRDGHSQFCKKCKKEIDTKYRPNYRGYRADYLRNRRQVDVNFRVIDNLRRRINYSIKNNPKSNHSIKLIGCSPKFLITYLEALFTKKMSWDNYGEIWEIDHIRPCASFDMSKKDQQEQCFNYKNLQPLLLKDNRQKGSLFEGERHVYK